MDALTLKSVARNSFSTVSSAATVVVVGLSVAPAPVGCGEAVAPPGLRAIVSSLAHPLAPPSFTRAFQWCSTVMSMRDHLKKCQPYLLYGGGSVGVGTVGWTVSGTPFSTGQ